MATLTYLNLVAWLLRVGHDDEAQRLARRELVPRLLGTHDQPAPAPPFSWRHPGSLRADRAATVGPSRPVVTPVPLA